MQTRTRKKLGALTLMAVGLGLGCSHTQATGGHTAEPPPMSPPQTAQTLTVPGPAFLAACQQDLKRAQTELARLKTLNPSTAPDKVLESFDTVQATLGNTASRAGLARNVHPDSAVRDAAASCEQALEKASTDLFLDKAVFELLAKIDVSGRDATTQLWMDRTLKQFRRSGVDRDEATRAKVKALSEALVLLGQTFSKNIAEDVRKVELTPAELAGMPADYVKAHPPAANGKVTVTTDMPDYQPFMSYAKNTKAREKLWRTYRQRADKNLETLSQLIAKRHELATVLGYKNWAAYATEMQMTGTGEVVGQFIDRLNGLTEKRATADMKALLDRKRKDDPKAKVVEPWEMEYYEDRVRSEKFGFDSQALRPYFEYSRVKQGAMDITSKMFGITFKPVLNAAVWHTDVETYDIFDGDTLLGRIHLDMHPRADKYKHAAQFDLVTGQTGLRYPEGVLVCNFPKPGEQPALMVQSQAETLFHEFGHLMHHIFAGRIRWHTVSGIRTEHDFVEVPSMLLQEWMSDSSTLKLFAKHYENGSDIPEALVQKLVASKEFGVGLWTRRQLFFSALSLDYYSQAPGFDTTTRMKELQPKFLPFRQEWAQGTHFQTTFGHLDGYSSNYYTYLWSVVIAKDLLAVFQKEGLLNPQTSARLRTLVLAPGGSKPAAAMLKDFLGREYDFQAFEAWLNGPTGPTPPKRADATEASSDSKTEGRRWN